jgi:hypothetical protein
VLAGLGEVIEHAIGQVAFCQLVLTVTNMLSFSTP